MPKRKASALDEAHSSSKQTRSTRASQQNMYTFTSVTKPAAAQANGGKKRKTAHKREVTPPPPVVKTAQKSAAPKRKRDVIPDSDSEDEIVVSQPADRKVPTESKPRAAPRHKRVKNAAPPTPAETPSKSAARLFDNLNIETNVRPIPISLPKKQLDYDTPPETPTEEAEFDLSFPAELEDLQDLFASFLAALSMHYSHNGTSTAPQILLLLPMITKHWKKRNVTQLDLQRILAIVPKQERDFVLEDSGRGGIRLVRVLSQGRAVRRAASYIDEEDLNNRFEDALQKLWHQWQGSTLKVENRTAAKFIDQLPLLEIAKNEAAHKTSALFSRGEQRLADLKAGQAAKVEAKTTQAETSQQRASSQSTASRSTALFDRILAKQTLAASQSSSGPTKAELERQSALQRIEDIARILALMCGMKERCSFSMQAVTQQLQQSLRNPISSVEVWRCLTLMATEVAPGFVKVVQSGAVQGVVVTRSGSLALGELRERVQRASEQRLS
ncbi:Putative DNA replication factor Cdt1 [Septoria linicola]|uniref:DNA replication factor Cdt1 n=1 Tax=Septoria linicola TaxID=215465 RepID=A0A9Q9AXW7_9PEZI|nr:Putative DNA replication factor Cdt1 [Septoria linicola]